MLGQLVYNFAAFLLSLSAELCKDRWDPEPCAMAIVYCLFSMLGCDALAAVCYFLYRGPVFMYVCYAQS